MFVVRLYLGLDIKFKPNLVAAGGRHKFDRLICALNSGLNLIRLNLRPKLTSPSQLVNSLLKTGLNLCVAICFGLRASPHPLKFSGFYRFCAPFYLPRFVLHCYFVLRSAKANLSVSYRDLNLAQACFALKFIASDLDSLGILVVSRAIAIGSPVCVTKFSQLVDFNALPSIFKLKYAKFLKG